MIRRLQRRLILLVLSGLLLASAGLVTAINWMNLRSVEKQVNSVLDMLTENGGERPALREKNARRLMDLPSPDRGEDRKSYTEEEGTPPPPPYGTPAFPMEGRGMEGKWNSQALNAANFSNFYTVTLDQEGAVTAWTSDRAELYTDEEINALAREALARGQSAGRIGSQYYRLADRGDVRQLIVVDARMDMQNAQSVLRVTVLVALMEDALLSLGAVWLIRRMVKPVDEAMEKQKQFVWDASHELKTPLAVISANAEALKTEVGENSALQYIQSEVDRTDHLIQNLLTLARLEKGTVKAAHASFDLSQALLEVALPFESAVFEAGKTMEMEIPDAIHYTGDQEMIKQLAVILLSNAVKYSDDRGSIRLSLEARGEKRILRVHNTGPAIPPEAQERIFDRFYRVDSSHNREIEGNGLGLAIAQSIVKEHKGKITVTSREGEGTAFTVIL